MFFCAFASLYFTGVAYGELDNGRFMWFLLFIGGYSVFGEMGRGTETGEKVGMSI